MGTESLGNVFSKYSLWLFWFFCLLPYFFSLTLLFKMEREWSRMCFSSQVCLIVFWLSSELNNRNAILGERGPETCIVKENKKMRLQREHGANSNATLFILDSESIMNVSVPKAHTSNGIHLPNLNPTKSLHHMKDELCLEKYDTGSIHLPWTLLSLLACNRVSPIFAGRPEWHHIWCNQHDWSALRWAIWDSSGDLGLRSGEHDLVSTGERNMKQCTYFRGPWPFNKSHHSTPTTMIFYICVTILV